MKYNENEQYDRIILDTKNLYAFGYLSLWVFSLLFQYFIIIPSFDNFTKLNKYEKEQEEKKRKSADLSYVRKEILIIKINQDNNQENTLTSYQKCEYFNEKKNNYFKNKNISNNSLLDKCENDDKISNLNKDKYDLNENEFKNDHETNEDKICLIQNENIRSNLKEKRFSKK